MEPYILTFVAMADNDNSGNNDLPKPKGKDKMILGAIIVGLIILGILVLIGIGL
ncbi:hypothetical protein [Rubellicoccus peritrichatus]|uniref:Uncharacterized protein n=1 Tax=Rubellicoccus peritrichatus TaxID=3080537 RepID=A0AAQ3LBZ1_9BACT|nr:hypothetical protein [Puniceicoccus sp. CR14]WOO40678.1 hypothetical protein RZN69_18815 [Puniceicoccus sp. CR14]